MKLKLATGFLAAAAMVVSTAASAALVTFNLGGGGGNLGGSETFSSGAYSVDARSQLRTFGSWSNSGSLRQTSGGLGVSHFLDSAPSQVDGRSVDEGVVFSFGYGVKLTDINLTSFGGNDDFWLYVYNGGSWSNVISQSGNENIGAGYYGSQFRISGNGFNDEFKIGSVTFDIRRDEGPGPVAASEPASLALLGIGALALGFSRRKA